MDKEDNKILTIIKSKSFLKIFCIPIGIWFFFALITLAYPNEPESGPNFVGFVGSTIFVLVIWFVISFFIAKTHKKEKTKNIKKEKKKWEEMSTLEKVKFSLIMSTFTFLIGILLSYDSIGFPLKAQFIIFLAAYIPFILFMFITFIIYINRQNKKVFLFFKASAIVTTVFLLFYYFIALFVVAFTEALNPMTNPSFYSYHIFFTPKLKDTFPSSIPSSAENIKFYYAPGVLQGGTRYTLYYIDENMTVEEFDKKYKDKSVWIGHVDDYKEKPGLLAGAFHKTPSEYNNENDYVIYLTYGRCYKPDSCNHGEFKLAAFNEKTKEIVYSSESW